MSKRDQLFTGSFHGSTSEEHETYFSESMVPTVSQLTAHSLRVDDSESEQWTLSHGHGGDRRASKKKSVLRITCTHTRLVDAPALEPLLNHAHTKDETQSVISLTREL